MLQRADVTDNRAFWAAWRYAQKLEADAASLGADLSGQNGKRLTSVLSLERSGSSGRTVWRAYRLCGTDSGQHVFGQFSLSFVLGDTSRLLPYQSIAVAHLCNSIVTNGAAADGSDTGIGKTYMALSVARNLGLAPAIICRKAGIATWERACVYMNTPALFITNWEAAKAGNFGARNRDSAVLQKAQDPHSGQWYFRWRLPRRTLLIFDEAHMGNHNGSQNNRMWVAAKGHTTLSLSATFADKPSRLRGLFTVLNIMPPEKFNDWLYGRGTFTNRYNEIESLSPVEDMKRINTMIFPRYGYRLSYDDPEVRKHFPKRVIQTLLVNLAPGKQARQNKEYRELLETVAKYRALGMTAEAMVADLRYRQAAELYKAQVLCELAVNYVEQGHSVVIFVNFRDTLRYCVNHIRVAGSPRPGAVYGGQPDRQEVIDEFQADRLHAICAMVDAGGQSISLHDVRGTRPRVSLLCPTYNPVSLKQALGRTFRSGTKSTPVMKLVYAANTVEEKVAENVNTKLANISALNDGDLMEPDLLGLLKAEDRKVEV